MLSRILRIFKYVRVLEEGLETLREELARTERSFQSANRYINTLEARHDLTVSRIKDLETERDELKRHLSGERP